MNEVGTRAGHRDPNLGKAGEIGVVFAGFQKYLSVDTA